VTREGGDRSQGNIGRDRSAEKPQEPRRESFAEEVDWAVPRSFEVANDVGFRCRERCFGFIRG